MQARFRLTYAVLAIATLTAAVGAQASNEETQERQGFFISGGAAYGSGQISAGNASTDRLSSIAGYFAIGGTINPHLRLGFESTGWQRKDQGATGTTSVGAAVVYLYPSLTSNVWVKGGLGLGVTKLSDAGATAQSVGLGYTLGVGVDIYPNHNNFALVPFAAFSQQVSGTASFNGQDTGTGMTSNVFLVGVGFGYRH